jgi:hypothetical protein
VARSIDQVIVSDDELAPFVGNSDLVSKARGLLQQQRGSWELLRTGYDSLQRVKTKVFELDGFQVKVQFNPVRMTSTLAKVDPHSIRQRQCFLCPDNLPPAQRGIPCEGEYLVLCNPFPIFPEHLTISSLHHRPQFVRDSVGAFLSLTRELGTRYAVLYNGPRCGASAPDHLHFQAGTRSCLPIDAEYDTVKERCARLLFESGSLRVWGAEKFLRRFIAFESTDAGVLRRAFDALYVALQGGAAEGEEPMLNVLGFHTNGEWRVLVFPRATHRPSFYFKEGDEQLLISPASVELGGLCTTPRAQDFEKVTREDIQQMYQEVCIAPEKLAVIAARLAPKLAALA